jgi:hypothetical protein
VNNCTNLGFPIAEISADGSLIITKEENAGGILNVQTVTAQLLYEIQGPLYYNSDVTARLSNINLLQEGPNRVRVTGVEGFPPPPTTKIGYKLSSVRKSTTLTILGSQQKAAGKQNFTFSLQVLILKKKRK